MFTNFSSYAKKNILFALFSEITAAGLIICSFH